MKRLKAPGSVKDDALMESVPRMLHIGDLRPGFGDHLLRTEYEYRKEVSGPTASHPKRARHQQVRSHVRHSTLSPLPRFESCLILLNRYTLHQDLQLPTSATFKPSGR